MVMVDLMVSEQQSGTAGKGVPAGFKLTEVGVIPEDWTIEALSAITEPSRPISYGIVQTGPAVINGIPCIRVVDISNGKIQTGNLITTSGKISESYRRTILQEGDIVIPLRGKVGEIAIVDRNIRGANLTRGVALIALKDEYYPQYVKQYLSSRESADRLLASMNGSALQEITIATLRRFPLAVPSSIKEQIAIACVLSDTDKLINTLEQFITKKQAIKTATMQKLLTGKTRLPQFALRADGTVKGYKKSELGEIPEDWTITLLNDVIDSCSSGATPYRGISEYYKGNNRWITSGELNYCVINDTIEKISDSAIKDTNLKIHPAGTFLMAITGLEAAGTRGACGIVGKPSATNQSCMAIYPNNKLDSNYLYHWYVYNGDTLAFKYCQGTKQLSYTAGLIRKIPLFLPTDKKEQTAIAAILSDMDKDIQTLQQRLDKTRQLKQGMMQELLTGKTRLI
ncbi:restriction endonuclease subunit S [Salmonella enterica subsp. enterica serovar Llandoff]|nr:restriction endonuclease subunit S [Salmonella enterica subsp. enterica serovar Llandoff]